MNAPCIHTSLLICNIVIATLGLLVLGPTHPQHSGPGNLKIWLRVGTIDARGEIFPPPSRRFNVPSAPLPDGSRLYFVQFNGPIQPEWLTRARAIADIGETYVPDFAFVGRMTPAGAQALSALDFVYAVTPVRPWYKASETLPPSGNSPSGLLVTAYSAADLQRLIAEMPRYGCVAVAPLWQSDRLAILRVSCPPAALPDLLARSDVLYVEPDRPARALMAQSQWVNQGYVPDQTPIWDRGLSGAGERIAIHEVNSDTCPYQFEYNSCFFDLAGVKIAFLGDPPAPCQYTIPDPPAPPYASFGCYHRMGVLAAAAGDAPPYGIPNDGPTYDALAYRSRLLLSSFQLDPFTFLETVADQEVRLASMSWACSTGEGIYTGMSAAMDDFVWEKQLQRQPLLIFFPAGNAGMQASDGIVAPGTAKNVVAVGATERYMAGYPAHSPENIASFSSRGPTDDGRIKPDVVAGGWKVQVPLLDTPDGSGCVTVDDGRGLNGTSFSTPVAAGAAALIREYYRQGYYPGGVLEPSAALVKATLINSGRSSRGAGVGGPIPGSGQGWGRITLDDVLFFAGETGQLRAIDEPVGLMTGESATYVVEVPNDGTEWELKITLVWSDRAGATAASDALVNDLDLRIEGPSGLYLGNAFAEGWSERNGIPDRHDNVEQIRLGLARGTLKPGTYSVTVLGAHVPAGLPEQHTQPYALLINLSPRLTYEQYLPIGAR